MKIDRIGVIFIKWVNERLNIAVFHNSQSSPRLCNVERRKKTPIVDPNEIKYAASKWNVEGFKTLLMNMELVDIFKKNDCCTVYYFAEHFNEIVLPKNAEWCDIDTFSKKPWKTSMQSFIQKVSMVLSSLEKLYLQNDERSHYIMHLCSLARQIATNSKTLHILFALTMRIFEMDNPKINDLFAQHKISHLLDEKNDLTQLVNNIIEIAVLQKQAMDLLNSPDLQTINDKKRDLLEIIGKSTKMHMDVFGHECFPFEAAVWKLFAMNNVVVIYKN
jgi:hypothetical protein